MGANASALEDAMCCNMVNKTQMEADGSPERLAGNTASWSETRVSAMRMATRPIGSKRGQQPVEGGGGGKREREVFVVTSPDRRLRKGLDTTVIRDEKGAPVIVCNHTTDRMSKIRGSIHHKEARRSNTKGKEGKASSNVCWGDDGGFKDVPGGEEGVMISRSQSAGSIMYRPLLSGFPGWAGSGDSVSGAAAAAAAAGGGGGDVFGRTSSAGSGAGAHGGALEFGRTPSEASKSSERGGIERVGSAGKRNQRVKGGGAGAEFGRSSSAGSARETATARPSGRGLHGVENRVDPGVFMSAQDDMERRLEKAGLSETAKAEMRAKEKARNLRQLSQESLEYKDKLMDAVEARMSVEETYCRQRPSPNDLFKNAASSSLSPPTRETLAAGKQIDGKVPVKNDGAVGVGGHVVGSGGKGQSKRIVI